MVSAISLDYHIIIHTRIKATEEMVGQPDDGGERRDQGFVGKHTINESVSTDSAMLFIGTGHNWESSNEQYRS
jgi:hypothetical protein